MRPSDVLLIGLAVAILPGNGLGTGDGPANALADTLCQTATNLAITTTTSTTSTTSIPSATSAPPPSSLAKRHGEGYDIDREREDLGRRDHRPSDDFHLTIVNSTPYRWRRGHTSSWGLHDGGFDLWWQWMMPGEFRKIRFRPWDAPWDRGEDAAGEVVYHVEGTSRPMSFMLRLRAGFPHHADVVFLEHMEARNMGRGAVAVLGGRAPPGGVGFVLAGTEGDFVCNGGTAAAWMADTRAVVGGLPLHQLAMPRSHHAGFYRLDAAVGLGSWANAGTQSRNLSEQLDAGGVRVIDLRPALHGGQFRESHLSRVACCWHGGVGPPLRELVDAVNRFNDEHPGELVIWDVSGRDDEAVNTGRDFAPLTEAERAGLYGELRRLRHRFNLVSLLPTDNNNSSNNNNNNNNNNNYYDDISRHRLDDFIGRGASAVLVRVVDGWAADGAFPGPAEGFVTTRQMPTGGRWTASTTGHGMVDAQGHELQRKRPPSSSTSSPSSPRDGPIHDMQLVLTQTDFSPLAAGLVEHSGGAWGVLYGLVWDLMSEEEYGNWLTMDDVRTSQLKDLVVAINHCFAARRCGAAGWAKYVRRRLPAGLPGAVSRPVM